MREADLHSDIAFAPCPDGERLTPDANIVEDLRREILSYDRRISEAHERAEGCDSLRLRAEVAQLDGQRLAAVRKLNGLGCLVVSKV